MPMTRLEAIQKKARHDLVIVSAEGKPDVRLWDHSRRVADAASLIAQLPEGGGFPVDTDALAAAALYHDAGWAVQYNEGTIPREDVGLRPTSTVQFELAAALVEESLHEVIAPAALETAAASVRALGKGEIDMFEAQLVREADNLDEFGGMFLWRMAHRHAADGTGIEAVIETWRTRQEYGYWTARLKDSFRFEAVRRLAEQRLKMLDRIVRTLQHHHTNDDLHALLHAEMGSPAN